MLSEIEKLLNFIQNYYTNIINNYPESNRINLGKKEVRDVFYNEEIKMKIINYKSSINKVNFIVSVITKGLDITSKIECRVKNYNSIQYKLEKYIQNKEKGKIPINKCLNDIFGVRIILNNTLELNTVKTFINEKFPTLKCIDSSKGDYKALHVYIKSNNYNFPWEVQIWNKEDEKNNKKSHRKYKQDYINWENKNKGGNK